MIKVHPVIYRVLWIGVAVLSAVLASMPLMFISEGVTVNDGGPVIIAGGVIGVFALIYSIRRLLRPLTQNPSK